MKGIKERLCKFALGLVAVPFLWIACLMILAISFVIPIIALIKPDIIIIKQNEKEENK